MRIALASSEGSGLISKDDALLSSAIRELGGEVESAIWPDPLVNWSRFDVVAIRTTWDYHLHLESFQNWLAEIRLIAKVFNDPELILWNAHKSYLLELELKGVRTVPTLVLEDVEKEIPWRHVVVKPEVGASALDALVFAPEQQAERDRHIETLLGRGKVLIQPYFKRVETEGELSLVYIEGEVVHAIQKRPKRGDFRVQVDYGGTNERVPIPEDGKALVQACMNVVPTLPLFARVDAVRDQEGTLHLMELELIEPELMFEWAPESASILAKALLNGSVIS